MAKGDLSGHDRLLGLGEQITRRDFIGSTLIGAGTTGSDSSRAGRPSLCNAAPARTMYDEAFTSARLTTNGLTEPAEPVFPLRLRLTGSRPERSHRRHSVTASVS